MTNLKEEVQKIEEAMQLESPLGRFARAKTPEYETLKCMVVHSGHELAIYEYITAQKKAIHDWNMLKLSAFMNGTEVDKSKMEAIEEKIAIFEENLKKGVFKK